MVMSRNEKLRKQDNIERTGAWLHIVGNMPHARFALSPSVQYQIQLREHNLIGIYILRDNNSY